MWFLIACVASPGAVQCIEAQPMPTSSICATVGQTYRQTSIALNPASKVEYRCIEVLANGATRENGPQPLDAPKLPPLRP